MTSTRAPAAGDDLHGRTALVTGASRGIGLAAARALHDNGANVVVTARTAQAARAAAAAVGPRALGLAAHVADADAAKTCVDLTIERFGSVDILVNNAATNTGLGPLLEHDHAQFAKTMEVNVWAPIVWCRLVHDVWMREHGGSIVNLASIGGIVADHGIGMYNLSKAAVIHLTRQLALELGPRIRVNAVAPGVVRTRMAEAIWRDNEDRVAAHTLLARVGEPVDIGRAIAFLAGSAATWITGQTLVVDGGQLIASAALNLTGAARPTPERTAR